MTYMLHAYSQTPVDVPESMVDTLKRIGYLECTEEEYNAAKEREERLIAAAERAYRGNGEVAHE